MNDKTLQSAITTVDHYMCGLNLTLDLISAYINSMCTVTDQDNTSTAIAKYIKSSVIEDFENWIDREVVGKIEKSFAEATGSDQEEWIFVDLSDDSC